MEWSKGKFHMNPMSISMFKAQAFSVINTVAKTCQSVVITKRGKPLAVLKSFNHPQNKSIPGKLSSTFVSEKDIISPLGEKIWIVSK